MLGNLHKISLERYLRFRDALLRYQNQCIRNTLHILRALTRTCFQVCFPFRLREINLLTGFRDANQY